MKVTYALLRIFLTTLALIGSQHNQICALPAFNGNLFQACGLATLLEIGVWIFGYVTGKPLKTVGLDADKLDEKSPPPATVVFFFGLLWLAPTAFLAFVNHFSPATVSLADWYSPALGGLVWLVISLVCAIVMTAMAWIFRAIGFDIGNAGSRQRNQQERELQQLEALVADARKSASNSVAIACLLKNVGDLNYKLGRYNKACIAYADAYPYLCSKYGNHPLVRDFLRSFAQLLNAMGYPSAAMRYEREANSIAN